MLFGLQALVFFTASLRPELPPAVRIASRLLGTERALRLAGIIFLALRWTDLATIYVGLPAAGAALYVAALLKLPRNQRVSQNDIHEFLDITIILGGALLTLITSGFASGILAGLQYSPSIFVVSAIKYGLALIVLNRLLVQGTSPSASLSVWFLTASALLLSGSWALTLLGGSVETNWPGAMAFQLLRDVSELAMLLAGLSLIWSPPDLGSPVVAEPWMRMSFPFLPVFVIGGSAGILFTLTVIGRAVNPASASMVLLGLTFLLGVRIALAQRDHERQVRLAFVRERRSHAERVKSLQHLAGGVAHHFNNLMTAVVANADHELSDAPAGSALREALEDIRAAGLQAASLTARLRTFAGDLPAPRQPVCLDELLLTLGNDIRNAAGGHVDVRIVAPSCSLKIRGDRALISASVIQLARNAGEAMPAGGQLTYSVETRSVTAADALDAILPAPPGEYAVLSARDTSTTMPLHEVHGRFDPFDTNVSPTSSLDLGLSVVYGAMAAHRGGISVESTSGVGTTVRLFFPAGAPVMGGDAH